MPYRVREATTGDADVLVRHRVGMFADMGVPIDPEWHDQFRTWLDEMMPAGVYRAWLVESDAGDVVAGGGLTVLPWPPGPRSIGGRVAFVYNVYTDPAQRHRGHARAIMNAIHAWCREAGIRSLALNASLDGQPLYESMGYAVADSPMMHLALD